MNEMVMKQNNDVQKIDQSVLRAVYALNMCTVSVSQIIDYNDIYILEQEYDAILNNLNLEKMPKAESLKNILVELLNTITFFRIQEIRKQAIEKDYQNRLKNAIWSAIPNLSVVVAGNPLTIAYSIAAQVGIGYMNYRKEKYQALQKKEKEELELRITAIEQFNALRRELFTTAWELAEEYEFPDRLRLTERQIKQYNEILMDCDELRKYARLEAIQDKFEAFPAFWYHFGHTACYIAGNQDYPLEQWEREAYIAKAKQHFRHYEELNKFNILREDQMTAAFALEYADLLFMEKTPDVVKIKELISVAREMSGTALDVKQLCAIAYLKIGNTLEAATLLKQLVNEDYNTKTNAKLLSRIYVSQFLQDSNLEAKLEYKTLVMRIGQENSSYLFPMPEVMVSDEHLQKEYFNETKRLLLKDYERAIFEIRGKYTVLFNAVIPAPNGYELFEDYYGFTKTAIIRRCKDIENVLNDKCAREDFLMRVKEQDFRFRYLELMNKVLDMCDDLKLWRESENHDLIIRHVKGAIFQKRSMMKEVQKNIEEGNFTYDDYKKMQKDLSFSEFMGGMLKKLLEIVEDAIDEMDSLDLIDDAEYNLLDFCQKYEIATDDTEGQSVQVSHNLQLYLEDSLLGQDGINKKEHDERIARMRNSIQNATSELLHDSAKGTTILLPTDEGFRTYFSNKKLNSHTTKVKGKTLAIIDEMNKKDCDILLTENGVLLVDKNRQTDYGFGDAEYVRDAKYGEMLIFGGYSKYYNKEVNIGCLHKLLEKLDGISK